MNHHVMGLLISLSNHKFWKKNIIGYRLIASLCKSKLFKFRSSKSSVLFVRIDANFFIIMGLLKIMGFKEKEWWRINQLIQFLCAREWMLVDQDCIFQLCSSQPPKTNLTLECNWGFFPIMMYGVLFLSMEVVKG